MKIRMNIIGKRFQGERSMIDEQCDVSMARALEAT